MKRRGHTIAERYLRESLPVAAAQMAQIERDPPVLGELKRKSKGKSPTSRSLDHMRKQGWPLP